MNGKQILNNLRAARRTLDSIPEVKILQDWMWGEEVGRWGLHCQICIESENENLIPRITDWYVLVTSQYPWGTIEFYPAKRNGLTHTFPHQNFNDNGDGVFPWRSGNICVSRSLRALSRYKYDSEPHDIYWQLHWHFKRAIQWLTAASQGKLVSPNEHFELPSFPVRASVTTIFSEGIESFTVWQQIPDFAGLLELVPLDKDSNTLIVKGFRLANGRNVLDLMWGKAISELATETVSGVWIRLKDIPVLAPWQAPSTWKELRDICREQEIEIDEQLKGVLKGIRDGKKHLLLVGFPIPVEVGGLPHQMHWQALELPVLSSGINTARGFRTNDRGYWQRDRTELLRGDFTLRWTKSENWHPDQITNRGKFPKTMSSKKVLLIGVGAIGSVVAELLIRGDVQNIALMDSDKLEIGNLSRHTLGRDALEENKAASVAKRLNLASPHAVAEAIEHEFPWMEEVHTSYIQQFEIVLDCTGSDAVLHHLEHFAWENEKVFISISLGMGGKRLFCFTAYGKRFPSNTYKDKLKPWLEKERKEHKDIPLPWSGIGCWHPVFPARVDDVWMMASVAVKHAEALLKSNLLGDELTVFEQIFDKNNNFCGVHLVEPDAGCE